MNLRIEGDEWLCNWNDTRSPGLYTVNVNDLPARYFTVSLDEKEGDFNPLSAAEKDMIQSQLAMSFTDNFNNMLSEASSDEGLREWWRYLIYLAILILCMELIVAWRFSK